MTIFAAHFFGWNLFRVRLDVRRCFAAWGWFLALVLHAGAAPLMEEGFNYPAGTSLAANPPWSGSVGPAVEVVAGDLTVSNLLEATPAGNVLQIGGGGSQNVHRNFSSSPVAAAPGTAVYFSALFNCAQLPTNSQFVAGLMAAGATSPSPPDDPVDLYVSTGAGGCRLGITSGGSDRATAATVLASNTTHLIVLKYNFGPNALAGIYIDPVPGSPEPASPNAQTEQSDDDGGGAVAPNLQTVAFHSPSLASQGSFRFDTLRSATNWADVTPMVVPASVTGPQDQAVCSGSPALFSVTASGLPPFSYQWRTNGIAVNGATNSTYGLPSPAAADTLNRYDVVVGDFYGSVTSQVASLAISHLPPSIAIPPANEPVMPGISNVTFSVSVAGDAPLDLQWRTNGIAISGATNLSYTLTNPGPADALNAIDVVASNPCGSITSTPPVAVYFPTIFYAGFDAGAGFFSGENLIFTNASGESFYAWSSPDPSLPVTDWTLEGPLSELPLGTSGLSRYGINLNPATSPVYYLFAQSNTGPYTPAEWVTWLTTPDFVSFTVASANLGITADGILEFPAPPAITQPPQSVTVLAGQNASFSVTATGSGLGYQWWSNGSGVPDASAPMLELTNVSAADAGPYFVIITNSLGSVTSSVATLTVALPPRLTIGFPAPGTIQMTAATRSNLTYVIQSATNLAPPVWISILTNNTGLSGLVSVQTNAPKIPMQFYRLLFPSTAPMPPGITGQPQSLAVLAGQNASFSVAAFGSGLGYQWFSANSGIPGGCAPALGLTNVSVADAGTYVVIITNSLGSATSSVATLTVALRPALTFSSDATGTIRLNGTTITNLTYVVQSATNLASPAWVSIVTNSTGGSGTVNFQMIRAGDAMRFYRLAFP